MQSAGGTSENILIVFQSLFETKKSGAQNGLKSDTITSIISYTCTLHIFLLSCDKSQTQNLLFSAVSLLFRYSKDFSGRPESCVLALESFMTCFHCDAIDCVCHDSHGVEVFITFLIFKKLNSNFISLFLAGIT